ncbi:unnamed protein product, partial [Mesorhabditis belari]|uniref:Uncharacterized protein n=1 Tax=Mesorhabditis belari TaxID=2138241 RepID=A0AAF3J5D3_9BILA
MNFNSCTRILTRSSDAYGTVHEGVLLKDEADKVSFILNGSFVQIGKQTNDGHCEKDRSGEKRRVSARRYDGRGTSHATLPTSQYCQLHNKDKEHKESTVDSDRTNDGVKEKPEKQEKNEKSNTVTSTTPPD